MPHGPIGESLDDDADGGADGHRADRDDDGAENRRIGVEIQRVRKVIPRERTEHVHVAVREIDEPQHAVHHRVPERDECVDGAERETVDELLEEGIH